MNSNPFLSEMVTMQRQPDDIIPRHGRKPNQMLAIDVLQLLQMVVGGEVGAEAFDCLIVAVFRAEAALPVVPGQLIQLGNEGVVNTICGHIEKAP